MPRRLRDGEDFWHETRGLLAKKPTHSSVAAPGGIQNIRREREEGGTPMAMLLIILAGLLSVVYGVVTTAALMKADAGNARMQEIAAAIAEGAQAYLKRQYITIGVVGVVIFVGRRPSAWLDGRRRLPHRRRPFGRGRLHRHERVGARQRAHGAGGDPVAGRAASTSPSRRARSPACWWPASRCSASSVYFWLLTGPAGSRPTAAPSSTRWSRSASAPR